MNNLLTQPQADNLSEKGEVVSALVAYEDSTTRDRALQVCDRLVQKFWRDVEFDFTWWRFDFLRDGEIAIAAANAATQSDLILL